LYAEYDAGPSKKEKQKDKIEKNDLGLHLSLMKLVLVEWKKGEIRNRKVKSLAINQMVMMKMWNEDSKKLKNEGESADLWTKEKRK
jgi:hypothetical protein